MASLNIDLQNDPERHTGRQLMEHLVGSHMVAGDEVELLHLVRHSLDDLHSMPLDQAVRVMTHAAYQGQAMIVSLLDLATRLQAALEDSGLRPDPDLAAHDPERYRDVRLDVWTGIRDHQRQT
jgi:ATP-dependent Clp protease adapter protein ClpS